MERGEKLPHSYRFKRIKPRFHDRYLSLRQLDYLCPNPIFSLGIFRDCLATDCYFAKSLASFSLMHQKPPYAILVAIAVY